MAWAADTAGRGAKIMFEVYREGGYDRRYRVVYFTELNDHNRDTELNRCLAGQSFLSGFLAEASQNGAASRQPREWRRADSAVRRPR